MRRCILVLFLTTIAGCAHYGSNHQARLIPVYPGTPLYNLLAGTNEFTKIDPLFIQEISDWSGVTTFLIIGKASIFKSSIKDSDGYERVLDVGSAEGYLDDTAIRSFLQGIGVISSNRSKASTNTAPAILKP